MLCRHHRYHFRSILDCVMEFQLHDVLDILLGDFNQLLTQIFNDVSGPIDADSNRQFTDNFEDVLLLEITVNLVAREQRAEDILDVV